MPFVQRFSGRYPSDEEIMAIEGITIVDLVPPAAIRGLAGNVVAVVGEFLKGTANTPAEVTSAQDMLDAFGGWSNYSNPGGASGAPGNPSTGGYDGNGFLAVVGRKFARLVLVNVKQDVGVATITCTLDPTKASEQKVIAPAGIRVADVDESDVFATIEDAVFSTYQTNVATAQVKVRRVKGTATAPTIEHVMNPEATGSVPTGFSLDCTGVVGYGEASAIVDLTDSTRLANYEAAIDALAADNPPANEVSMIALAWHPSGTTGAALMKYAKQHALDVAAKARGRAYVAAPPVGTPKVSAGKDGSGVMDGVSAGICVANVGRSDRVWYTWPSERIYVRALPAAYVTQASDGYVDWPCDTRLAGVVSLFPPWENPAQVSDAMASVLGLESSAPALTKQDYINIRAQGVVALRLDATFGPEFQSGVTSVDPVAQPSLINIARRRMADYLQDSLAAALHRFTKMLNTQARRSGAEAEIRAFLMGLLSPANTARQVIDWFEVDAKSANTKARMAKGIVTFIVRVRTLPSMDFIVLQTEIGETVAIYEQAA